MDVENVAIGSIVWPNGGRQGGPTNNFALLVDQFGEDSGFDGRQGDTMRAGA